MNAETLTPMSEIYFMSSRIRVTLPFPSWVETDKVGVNIPRTERLMNLGGIRHIRFVGDVDGEHTSAVPVSVGLNTDGSQIAGMGSLRESVKMQTLERDGAPDRRASFRNAEWTSATIRVNLNEIQRRIHDQNKNLRNAASWTPYLDKSLRWGIRKAGSEHVLTNFTAPQKIMSFLINIHNNLLMSTNLTIHDILSKHVPTLPNPGYLLFCTAANFALFSMLESVLHGKDDGSGSGYRLSLFPGYEIDRAAVLQVLSRTKRVVAPIT